MVVKEFQKQNNRIQYFRQIENFGACNNFKFVLEKATGEYFMWLGDDDWIDNNYIYENLVFLEKNKNYKLSSGALRYFDEDSIIGYSKGYFNYFDEKDKLRLFNYLKWKGKYSNWIFYGLIRIENKKDLELREILGMDWIIVARIIFKGKINILDTTYIYKSRNGASKDEKSLLKILGLPKYYRNFIFLIVSINIFKDIMFVSNIYKKLNFLSRFCLAMESFFIVFNRFWLFQLPLFIFIKKIKLKLIKILFARSK